MDKRAVTLYRVSTKGQLLNGQSDIPLQKNACLEFSKMQGFSIIHEFTELGVSGFKVSTKDRDPLSAIQAMAERKEFDVFLVFMFDRIGRRANETSDFVQKLLDQGIEVWSVVEGQQKDDTHVDKLTNYIRYWQAEGESKKTSERMKEKQAQMFENNEWRGGPVPYGYKLVPNGRFGKKNRALNDMVKDPESGIIVDVIWSFVTFKGYGYNRLANYLNETYPVDKFPFSKIWTPQSIRTIIRNTIYKGRQRMNGMLSDVNESLRYVSDSVWDLAQLASASRITRKYPKAKDDDYDDSIPEGQTKASVYGATLLSGLLYCGHCRHKLVGTYHARPLKGHNGKAHYHRPIYRCYANSNKAKGCDGLSVYSAEKIEKAVLKAIRSYFNCFQNDVERLWEAHLDTKVRLQQSTKLKSAKAAYDKLLQAHEKLKEEVIKSMIGESVFEASMIQSMLEENAEKTKASALLIKELEFEQTRLNDRVKQLAEQYEHIHDWADIFDQAEPDEKKMILARMIEKIEVTRDYHIKIRFFIALEDFRQAIEESEALGYNIVIEEVSTDVFDVAM